MAAQSYANHAHRPLFWQITWLGAVVALVMSIVVTIGQWSTRNLTLLLLAATMVGAVTVMRMFALKLQDRIIRLEVHVRLARLGQEQYLPRLSTRQIVALRFASDAELPALLARTVADNLTPDQIKRAVVDWQADNLRT
jgi:hypothetical protein